MLEGIEKPMEQELCQAGGDARLAPRANGMTEEMADRVQAPGPGGAAVGAADAPMLPHMHVLPQMGALPPVVPHIEALPHMAPLPQLGGRPHVGPPPLATQQGELPQIHALAQAPTLAPSRIANPVPTEPGAAAPEPQPTFQAANVGDAMLASSKPQHAGAPFDESLREVFDRIKTHFPPAKVKKIMQTDEDIGKVSQATPVIAGRSLEFFIATLVKRSGDAARERGSKRITAEILKDTIMRDEKFDFLRENVCDAAAHTRDSD